MKESKAEPKIGGIHHIGFNVCPFDESVRFYTETLGMKVVLRWGSGNDRCLMLDTGDGSRLEFFEKPQPGTPDGSGSYQHFALRTADCDAMTEKVRAAGMEIIHEPASIVIQSEVPLPVRIAFFKGPFGETVELFSDLSK